MEPPRRRRPGPLADLLAQHGHEIQGVAYLILRDRSAADAVVVHTLLTALDRGAGTRDPDALRAWLLRNAADRALHVRRSEARITQPHVATDRAASATDEHERVTLLGVVARLPPRLRAAIVLRYYANLPVHEVDEALGISADTVNTQLRQALGTMRDMVAVAPATWQPATEDELDPRLEASLRLALHGEADSLPLLVREQDIEGARRARQIRRVALPAGLVGVAAVLALLVGTGTLTVGDGPGVGATSSPSPALPPLATCEELLAMMGPGAVPLLRGEQTAATDVDAETAEVDLGVLPAGASLAYGVSCLGGSIDIVIVRAGVDVGTNRANCSIKPYVTWVPDLSALGRPPLDGTEHVVVRSSGGVRWRVVVAEHSLPAPSMIVVRPTATPLPSPSLPAAVEGETPLVVVQVAGNGRGRPGKPVDTGVAATTFDQVVVTGACVGDGIIDVTIDGVPAQYPCAAFGPDVFMRDADTWLTIRAVATGAARFVLRVSAWTPPSG